MFNYTPSNNAAIEELSDNGLSDEEECRSGDEWDNEVDNLAISDMCIDILQNDEAQDTKTYQSMKKWPEFQPTLARINESADNLFYKNSQNNVCPADAVNYLKTCLIAFRDAAAAKSYYDSMLGSATENLMSAIERLAASL